MIRIVGLSATLPNYKDVGLFLGVNVDTGLFYFDASYRPVPLEMQFVGVTEKRVLDAKNVMDEICYEKVGCFIPQFVPFVIICSISLECRALHAKFYLAYEHHHETGSCAQVLCLCLCAYTSCEDVNFRYADALLQLSC